MTSHAAQAVDLIHEEPDLLPYEIESVARTMKLHNAMADIVRRAIVDGIAIGLEKAAKVCDEAARLYGPRYASNASSCRDCAEEIRSLKDGVTNG